MRMFSQYDLPNFTDTSVGSVLNPLPSLPEPYCLSRSHALALVVVHRNEHGYTLNGFNLTMMPKVVFSEPFVPASEVTIENKIQ